MSTRFAPVMRPLSGDFSGGGATTKVSTTTKVRYKM